MLQHWQLRVLFCSFSLCSKSQCTNASLHLFSTFCTQKSWCAALLIRGTFWLLKRSRKGAEFTKTWQQLPPQQVFWKADWFWVRPCTQHVLGGVTSKPSSHHLKAQLWKISGVNPKTCLALRHLPSTPIILQNSMKTKCGLA